MKTMTQVNRFRIIGVAGMMTAMVVAVVALSVAPANAAYITGVSIDDFSSQIEYLDWLANYTIDGSGFDATTGWHVESPVAGNMWASNGSYTANGTEEEDLLPAHITFDLGSNYDLASTTVWNFNDGGSLDRGANAVTISVADSVGGTFTSLGDFTFDIAPGSATTDFGQNIALSGGNNVRLVRFDITSNHGDTQEIAGLSEVRFTAIPEPASLGLIGLMGAILLIRRKLYGNRK